MTEYRGCFDCADAMYIGEGDFICDADIDGEEQERRGLVASDWEFEEEMPCDGRDWRALWAVQG